LLENLCKHSSMLKNSALIPFLVLSALVLALLPVRVSRAAPSPSATDEQSAYDARFMPLMRRYTREDGLLSNKITALAQDKVGFIWVGTERGLVRFDGRKYQVPSTRTPLPPSSVESLSVDSYDRLWISFAQHGICALQANRTDVLCFNQAAKNGVDSNDIFASFEIGERIVLCPFEQDFVELDAKTLQVRGRIAAPQRDVLAALSASAEDAHAYIAATSGKAYRVELTSAQSPSLKFVDISPQALKPAYALTRWNKAVWLTQSREGALVNLSEPDQVMPLPGIRLVLASAARSNEIVVGHEHGIERFSVGATGLQRTSLRAVPANNATLPEGQIAALLQDRAGGFWLGSHFGLAYWSARGDRQQWLLPARFFDMRNSSILIDAVDLDQRQQLWLATRNIGLQGLAASGAQVGMGNDTSASNVGWAVRADDSQAEVRVWYGHQNGISVFQPSSEQWLHASDNGQRMLSDLIELDGAGGAFVSSGRRSVRHYSGDLRIQKQVDEKQLGGEIEQLALEDDQLIIAGSHGISLWHQQTLAIVQPIQASVFAYCRTPDARYFATQADIVKTDLRWQEVARTARNSPLSGDIGSLNCSADRLIASGNDGIWSIDAQTLALQRLPIREAALEFRERPTRLIGDTVLLSSQQGVLRLRLSGDTPKPLAFELRIEPTLAAFKVPLDSTTSTLRALALQFERAEETQFSFSLKPEQANFSSADQLDLRTLGFGQHQVYVQARAADGFTARLAPLSVHVEAPLWRKLWAQIAMGLVLLSAMSALIIWLGRLRTRRQLSAERYRSLNALALARTETLGLISHEMRNLLNGVTANAELLRDTTDAQQQLRFSQRIAHSGEALAQLLDQALDHAKLVGEKLVLEQKAFDLHELLSDIEASQGVAARAKQLRFVSEFDNVDVVVSGDRLRLQQIIVNLLNNAIKFTTSGSVLLRAHAIEINQHIELRIQVFDSGVGIPLEQRDNIFKPYVRLQSGMRGSGLGLSVCAELCKLMQGNLSVVDSLPDYPGAAFEFQLRLPKGELSETNAVVLNKKLHVLVVEDEANNQVLIQALFERTGHRVHIAGNSFAAMQAVLQVKDFDAVLLDLDLDGESGFDALSLMRSVPAGQHLPVFALTGRAEADMQARCRNAGMLALIAKPYRWRLIESTLATHLNAPHV
jgi:signal transduction histidine kinase/CheY-like chemotaxis protein